MEDFFRKNVCSLCCNKSKNCKLIKTELQGSCTICKCLNYKRKKVKSKGTFDIEEYFLEKIIGKRKTPFNRYNKYYSQYISQDKEK